MEQTTIDRRDELIAEISHRMKSSEEMTKLLYALEIEKQPPLALENWLRFLRNAKVRG